mgnify:CR=1 FL=1
MENYNAQLDAAMEKFRKILEKQLVRVEDMKAQGDFTDYASLDTIRIGVCGGDGIGPIITKESAFITGETPNLIIEYTYNGKVVLPGPETKKVITKSSKDIVIANL